MQNCAKPKIDLFCLKSYTQMMRQFTMQTKNAVQMKLQNGTDGFSSWCLSNNMFVHFQKTSAMWVGVWQTLQGLDSLDIYLANKKSTASRISKKLLRIVIDRSFNWYDQINTVCLNISRKITLLKQ